MDPEVKRKTEKVLLGLKEAALAATQRADAEFYRNYLADDCVALVPYGVFSKEAIVKQMGSGSSSFKSSKIEDTRAIVLSEDSGLVTYKATFESQPPVFVTTVYARIQGEWKGVLYQQTPILQKS